jgi:hypothetical protein
LLASKTRNIIDAPSFDYARIALRANRAAHLANAFEGFVLFTPVVNPTKTLGSFLNFADRHGKEDETLQGETQKPPKRVNAMGVPRQSDALAN